MTYVAALIAPFGVAILADRKISFSDGRTSKNAALKTGRLCDHAIYGIAGSAGSARSAIEQLQKLPHENGNHTQWWDFAKRVLASKIRSDGAGYFELLIGFYEKTSQLWLFESNRGFTQLDAEPGHFQIYTIGSGKELLDGFTSDIAMQVLKEGPHATIPSWAIPYTIASQLSNYVSSFGITVADRHDVGGVFDIVLVDGLGARYQEPALYASVNADPTPGVAEITLHRVAPIDDLLVIETLTPSSGDDHREIRQTSVFMDSARGDQNLISEIDESWLKEQLDGQPFYQFCGVGFGHPDLRHVYSIHSGGHGEPWAISPSGQVNQELQNWINAVLHGWNLNLSKGKREFSPDDLVIANVMNVNYAP